MDIWISPIFQVLSPIAQWRFSIAKAVQSSPNGRHIAKSGNPGDTSLLCLTFQTTTLPSTLLAGYIRYNVEVFIPNPMRCYKCQRFVHTVKFCNKDARCHKCGEAAHEGSACSSPVKCLSCGSTEHNVSSKECPIWKKEKEICTLKATSNMSYPQARRTVEEKISTPTSKTYAQATKSKQTVSSGTQTEPLPQLPPLKLLTPPKPATNNTSTSTSTPESPVTQSTATDTPSGGDRPAPQATNLPGPSGVNTKPKRPTKPNQLARSNPPPPPPPHTRLSASQERQSRPAVRMAMGHSRLPSSSNSRPSSQDGRTHNIVQ